MKLPSKVPPFGNVTLGGGLICAITLLNPNVINTDNIGIVFHILFLIREKSVTTIVKFGKDWSLNEFTMYLYIQ